MVSKEARRIESMFGSIAPVYDTLNHAFSLNIDTVWRRYAARTALRPTDRRVLDLACGTGDLTKALQRYAPPGCEVLGADFCEPMLRIAQKKSPHTYLHADGLQLPFEDGSFDLVTIAFGLRNMEQSEAGLAEMHRVLAPGGRLAVLEFTLPTNPLVRAGYLTYFTKLLPAAGRVVSGSKAYGYLSDSVMEWPRPKQLAQMMKRAGFNRVRYAILTFGVAALHLAERPRQESPRS